MYKKLIFLVLLIRLSIPNLMGQFCANPPSCIINAELEPDNPAATGNMNSGGGTNINGWGVSHGDPSITTGLFGKGVFMWARTPSGGSASGEGIYTCFNFQQGHTYQMCFYVRNNTTNSSGNLFIRAVNNLSTTSSNIIPSVPTSSEIIHSSHTYSANWVQHSTTFTPSANYTGIWVYPYSAYDYVSGLQYEVDVDIIRINEAQPSSLTVSASPGTIGSCSGSTLSVTDFVPGSTFKWTPATGLSSTTGSSVTARPCSTTIYTVEITNPCSLTRCVPYIFRDVTVTVDPGIDATATPSTISNCESSTLTAISSDPMQVTWSPSTGLNTTQGAVVTASPCSTTTYTATFYCPQSGCTFTKQVTVNVQSGGSIQNNSPQPCYSAIDLEYVGNVCTGSAYYWYIQDNPIPIYTGGPHYYKATSTDAEQGKMYKLIIITRNGCKDSLFEPVVKNCCDVVADFDIIDCNPVRFENKTTSTNMSGVQGEWFWDFGDGTTSTLKNPSHLFNPYGITRTVCLTAVLFDGSGSTCCDKVCKEVTTCDWSCTPKAAFDHVIIDPGLRTVQYTDKSVGGYTACQWEWSIDGGPPTYTTQNPLITLPPGLPPNGKNTVCLKVWFCGPNGLMCEDVWCEEIYIP